MSPLPDPVDRPAGADTPAAAEARRRRRWLTFAETVGVIALLISAASFWDSHQERVRSEAREAAPKAKPKLTLTSKAVDDGARLDLAASADGIVVQTQTVIFPKALDASAVDTTGDAHIDASWFESGLLKTVPDHDGTFTGRMPVGIITKFEVNGESVTDTALYDLGYTLHPRTLRSDRVELQGLSLVSRGLGDKLEAKLEARWKAGNPG
ncbi:hypothetical protein [Polymorphobacter arshaanensis]|uniref:hypothetical protein n=1 Tax=Glacieibacterium arshaanense TaxID=2511025 RepID=UPI001A9CAD2E|nr:hypothetical protein [Polymorphobacter arshaanensis]